MTSCGPRQGGGDDHDQLRPSAGSVKHDVREPAVESTKKRKNAVQGGRSKWGPTASCHTYSSINWYNSSTSLVTKQAAPTPSCPALTTLAAVRPAPGHHISALVPPRRAAAERCYASLLPRSQPAEPSPCWRCMR
eukprot:350597-Chlamydomonas_euryale.AAC.6